MTKKTQLNDRKKPTRGKRSKVDLLPVAIRKRLDKGLRDGSITQVSLLDEINQLIEDAGLPPETKLSKAGLNRYASRMEQVGHNLREVREVTRAWVAELGDKPTGEVTQLVLEMGRTQLFKAMLNENDKEVADVGLIKDAMLAVQRLESAAASSFKREKEIRAQFAKEVADMAEKVAAKVGLTTENTAIFKQQILGIA